MLNCFELAHKYPVVVIRAKQKLWKKSKDISTGLDFYKWVNMPLHDCLECQKSKSKGKDLNEAHLQQWGQLGTIPLKTIHIDHKGPLRPSSHGKNFCLVVIDAFFRYLQVHPCTLADSKETIKLLEKYITTFGIPQQFIHDHGNAFMSYDFTHWSFELGIT